MNSLHSSSWSSSMNSNQAPISSSSSSSLAMSMSLWHDTCQDHYSLSQLLLGGTLNIEADHEAPESKSYIYGNEEIMAAAAARASWGQNMMSLPVSSPRSCVTTSFSSHMVDFSSSNPPHAEKRHLSQPLDHSPSECNSKETGVASKKMKVALRSTQSPFKGRKEKLGDRITALHQLVSPFGKTDTASVLLEAIGYIRFLQNQVQALSSPYLGSCESDGTRPPAAQGRSCIFPEDPGQVDGGEPKKDLRSRGLCLVPLSCTLHVGRDNGADYWAASLSAGLG